jgi:hypothetical protein
MHDILIPKVKQIIQFFFCDNPLDYVNQFLVLTQIPHLRQHPLIESPTRHYLMGSSRHTGRTRGLLQDQFIFIRHDDSISK